MVYSRRTATANPRSARNVLRQPTALDYPSALVDPDRHGKLSKRN